MMRFPDPLGSSTALNQGPFPTLRHHLSTVHSVQGVVEWGFFAWRLCPYSFSCSFFFLFLKCPWLVLLPESHLLASFYLAKNCNHKGLGLYYLCSALLFGVSGTLCSMILRLEVMGLAYLGPPTFPLSAPARYPWGSQRLNNGAGVGLRHSNPFLEG